LTSVLTDPAALRRVGETDRVRLARQPGPAVGDQRLDVLAATIWRVGSSRLVTHASPVAKG